MNIPVEISCLIYSKLSILDILTTGAPNREWKKGKISAIERKIRQIFDTNWKISEFRPNNINTKFVFENQVSPAPFPLISPSQTPAPIFQGNYEGSRRYIAMQVNGDHCIVIWQRYVKSETWVIPYFESEREKKWIVEKDVLKTISQIFNGTHPSLKIEKPN